MARKKTEPAASQSAEPASTPAASVRERVIAHVAAALNTSAAQLTDTTLIAAQPKGKGGLDSMGIWTLMETLEAEFGANGKLTALNNNPQLRLSDVVALVEKAIGG